MESIFIPTKRLIWNNVFSSKRFFYKLLLLLLVINTFNSRLNAQCNPNPIRPIIDGNPCEWPTLLSNSSFASGFEHDVFNVSNSSDDQYTQGSSDPNPISTWVYNLGNTNNKTDIANAGSFYRNLGSDANPENHLYFFGDRTSLNGDANFGFWFFRSAVGLQPLVSATAKFTGSHTLDTNPNDNDYSGDIFIVSAFEGGGAHPKMKIYNLIAANNNAGFDFQVVTEIDPGVSTQYGNAAVNTQAYIVPTYSRVEVDGTETWQYAQSNGATGYPSTTKIVKINGQNVTVYAGAFFEGDLNLTALGIEPCFATFLLATRNSQSLNASLQDFVTGEVNITPPPPTVTPDADCFPNALTLGASCSNGGSTPQWYTAATGGNPVATGSTFTIAANTAAGTYTYYVSCKANGASCESARVPVTGTIYATPTVDGIITNDNTSPFDMKIVNNAEVVDNVVDEFNLNTDKYKVVNFTSTSNSGGSGTSTITWAELNPSSADDIIFTDNGDGTAKFEIKSLTGISDFYNFRVTISVDHGKDNNGNSIICTATQDVKVLIRRSSPACQVTGPEPCPGTTANYKYDPDGNGTADAIPDGFTAQWSIVSGDNTKPNSNGAALKSGESTTSNSVNVVTQLNCNSEFTIRITLSSASGLSSKSCELRVRVVDNTPPTITNCPADIEIACGASIDPDVNSSLGKASATDACTVVVTYADRAVENCSRKAITRTWTAADPCGNKSTCVQLITVTDKVAPDITCPTSKLRSNNSALVCGASTLPANTGTATAVDACANSTVIVYYKDIPKTNNNTTCGDFVRTWYAVDASGNISSCNQTIEFAAPQNLLRAAENNNTSVVVTSTKDKKTASKLSVIKKADKPIERLQVQAFPNPFSNKVTFRISSPVSGKALLEVYNLVGQKIGVVYQGAIKSGEIMDVEYDARKANRATLIYKLKVNDNMVNGKLIQLK